jgi:MFS family permease
MRLAFRNPWWVVFGATIGMIVSNGPILQFTFGVFLKPVTREFGWNRGTMAAAIVICHLLGAIATPFLGRMIDRFGIRRVTLPFIALFALATAAISRTPASPIAFMMLYAVCGLVSSGQAPQPYVKAISAWFDSKRGLALGIATAGIGIGAALMPQLARLLIDKFGWRSAYVGLGIVTFALAFPAVALFVREPDGYLERFRQGSSTIPSEDTVTGMTVGEAVKSSARFWIIAVTALLVATAVNGTIAHIVPLLTDRGLSNQLATLVLTASGLALIGGRLLGGYLLDRFFGPYVAACFFLLPFVGVALLGSGSTGVVPEVAAIGLGLGLGSETALIAFLAGRYFGMRHYGEIYGYLFAVFLFGSGLGPWLMGVCFDATGSYNIALGAFGLALLVASFLISRLGPYAYPVSGDSGIVGAETPSAAASLR